MDSPVIPPMPPPYTSVPDYVWADVRDCALQFAPMTRKRQEPSVPVIVHPDGESALKAAKQAVKEKTGRYYGRSENQQGRLTFNVYENGKVVVRHVVARETSRM